MKYIFFILILLLSLSMMSANEDKEICKSVYHLILRTNWQYNFLDLEKIEEEFNITDVQNYIDGYIDLCYIKYYSEKLPEKVVENKTSVLINKTNCTDLEVGFDMLDFTFPKLNIFIDDLDCNKTKISKFFVKVEQKNGNFYFRGIRFWVLMLIPLGILCYLAFKDSGFIKKKAKGVEKELKHFVE